MRDCRRVQKERVRPMQQQGESKLPIVLMVALGAVIVVVIAWATLFRGGGCSNASSMNCGSYGNAHTGRQ